MVEKRDYYEVLGVLKECTQEEIKVAYRKLARTNHPDVAENRAEAEVKFREINEAYSVLSDENKRAHYDRFGHQMPAGGGPGDGFGDLFGGLGDLFDVFFSGGGGQRGGPNRPQRGSDLRQFIEITLEESFGGVEREIKYNSFALCGTCKGTRAKAGSKPETCPHCNGTGQIRQVVRTAFGQMVRTGACAACGGRGQMLKDLCDTCGGKGAVPTDRTVSVKIPPGVDSGQMIRMEGLGNAGMNGGPAGDLYLVITVKPHAHLNREGDDLFLLRRIVFTDAALGTEIEIETLEGKSKLKIPAGTQSGTVFKVRGKGMPVLQGYGRGDLHVEINVMVPTKLNDKQRKMLKEFAGAGSQEAEEHKGFFQKVLDAILG
ncbi:MAG TPA: molecular chaperone DnaJ [Candidatus Xenobia bacterium]|jgi:molecular chaperone DnaJ